MNGVCSKVNALEDFGSKCSFLVEKPKIIASNINSKIRLNSEIKKAFQSRKRIHTMYADAVIKHRMEKIVFSKTLSNVSLNKKTSSKSMLRKQKHELYTNDYGSTLRKFVKVPKNTARIWKSNPEIYRTNPIDIYHKMGRNMKSTFLKFYDEKIEKDNNNIKKLLGKILSIEVDSLSLSNWIKIVSMFYKVVPDTTVKKFGKPKMMKKEIISRLIHRDLKSLKGENHNIAFGTSIANSVFKPNKYDFITKYVNISHPYSKLETFESVWKGILNLETTNLFCKWLKEHDDVEPPVYLVKEGRLQHINSANFANESYNLFEGYKLPEESIDYFGIFNKPISEQNKISLSSLSNSSSLSFDISDINIII